MQNIKRFEEFQKNVIGWAEDKGIYEFSTPLAQVLKAVSELGELADAVIKSDVDGVKDAIGDIAVCLINTDKMYCSYGFEFTSNSQEKIPHSSSLDKQDCTAELASIIGELAASVADLDSNMAIVKNIKCIFILMKDLSAMHDLDFLDCCESAWLEIKDRKGRMVEGGAFVKDE